MLELGHDLAALSGRTSVSTVVADSLRKAQKSVRDLQPGLVDPLAAEVQDLVTNVGILRVRADTHTYDAGLRDAALTSYRAVLAACV